LPVIASGINGIPEAMREPENGILLRPGDREALARAIVELAGDPARRIRIGAANRERAEREFDSSQYARTLGAIYARALGAASVAK
jgi:glycosyltransferase involved in cell wall biosynthesis